MMCMNSLERDIMVSVYGITKYAMVLNYTDYDQYSLRNKILFFLHRFQINLSNIDLIFAFFDRFFTITSKKWVYKLFNDVPIQNPKTLSIFIFAYVKLYKIGYKKFYNEAIHVGRLLCNHIKNIDSQKGCVCAPFSHFYSTNSAHPKYYTDKEPNTLLTSLAGKAFISLYDMTGDPFWLSKAEQLANFFTEKNTYSEMLPDTICYRYFLNNEVLLVHNANTSVASFLALLSTKSVTQRSIYQELALKATQFTIKEQFKNGGFPYFSQFDERYAPHIVDNYHTGFVICDLIDVYESLKYDVVLSSVKVALNFYLSFFKKCGAPRFNIVKQYPINIHNISQGIITFTRARSYIDNSQEIINKIINYAFSHLRSADGLFFYEISFPGIINKALFLRWNQGWMLYALSLYMLLKNNERRCL